MADARKTHGCLPMNSFIVEDAILGINGFLIPVQPLEYWGALSAASQKWFGLVANMPMLRRYDNLM